jgi:AsmA protein
VRIAKWIAIILGGVVLLVVAAVFVLTSVVDPNRYRGKIEGIVADLAGRPFVIQGDLAITWYPWLGIRTGAARLENAPGVAGAPLVEWQSIAVAAKVWPLLHGEVVADRIRLQSPSIHLRRDAQGHGNWEGIGGSHVDGADARRQDARRRGVGGTTKGTTGERKRDGNDSDAGRPAADAGGRGDADAQGGTGARGDASRRGEGASSPVQIAGVEIRDGTVDYVDEGSGAQVTLSNVELDVGEWRAGKPLPVHAKFLAHTHSLPADGVWVQVDAPELAVRPSPLSVVAPRLTLKVANAQVDGDFNYEQTGYAQVTEPDSVGSQATDAQVKAHGALVLKTPSLRELANSLALNQSLPHDPATLGPLELTTTWSYDDGSIAAKPLALTLDSVNFNGWVQRTAPPKAMWGFELHGDRIDLSRYLNVDSQNKKPFELPVDALRAIQANGSLIFDQVVLADTQMANVHLTLQSPEENP